MSNKTINDLAAIAAAGVASNDQVVLWDTSALTSVKVPMTDVLQAAAALAGANVSIPSTIAFGWNSDTFAIRKALGAVQLQGATVSTAGILSVPDPTTNVAALTQTIHGSNAWAQATGGTNQTGGNTVVIPGCGTRYLTVTNFASIAGGATVTVTVDGTATILTNSSWNVTSNNQTATNIAAAINASGALNTSLVATASTNRVYLTLNGNIGGVILATSDGTNLAVTSGADGSFSVQRPGGSATSRNTFVHTGTDFYIDNLAGADTHVRRAGTTCFRTTNQNGIIAFGPALVSGLNAGIIGVTAGVVAPVDAAAGNTAGGFIQNTAGDHRVTADITNATTTLANITELSTTYIAGRKYVAGRMRIDTLNATAGDGVKLDLNGGTATWTSITVRYKIYDTSVAAPIASGKTTAIATAITAATVTGTAWAEIEYCGVLNAVGTLIPRYAKNSDAAGATLTLKANSEHTVKDSPN